MTWARTTARQGKRSALWHRVAPAPYNPRALVQWCRSPQVLHVSRAEQTTTRPTEGLCILCAEGTHHR